MTRRTAGDSELGTWQPSLRLSHGASDSKEIIMMLITDHQCQVAGHAPGSGGPGSRAGRAGTQAGPSETRTARRPALSMPGTTTPRTHWHRGTGSPWHGPPRLAAESLHCQAGRTRLGLGLRRRPESAAPGPGRPDSESEPGPGPSPIGRSYDSDSSHLKGHWHDPPTRLVRAAPGADSARPGEPERRDARNITEISEISENIENIAEEELSPAGPASPGEKYLDIFGYISNIEVLNSGLNFQHPDFTSNATHHRPRRFWLAFVLFTKLLEWKN